MNRRRLIGAGLLALVILPALLATPDPAAGVDSDSPLGLGGVAERVQEAERPLATIFASPAALRAEGEVPFVMVPGVPETLASGEARSLSRQMAPGGQLVLLDESGGAKLLTEPAGIQVVPEPLLDPSSPYGDPRFVEARAHLDGRSYDLLLSSPTLLDVNASRASVVAVANDTLRDVDRSGSIEPSDPAGAHPVVAVAQLDDARLIVAADAGLFTNTLLEDPDHDNAALLEDLLAQAPPGTVVLDASRHDPPRAMAPVKTTTQGLLWVATDRLAVALVVAAAAAGTFVMARRAPDRAAWGEHEHEVGRVRPLDPEDQRGRLRRLVIRALSDHGDRDPSELMGLSDEDLDEMAQQVLGTGELLRGPAGMGARFRNVRRFLGSGGPN